MTTPNPLIIPTEHKIEWLKKEKPTFCSARYLQSHLNLSTGTTASCHHTPWHALDKLDDPNPDSKDDLHNTNRKIDNRVEAVGGSRPSDCSYCWNAEDRGSISDRILKTTSEWSRTDINYSSLEQQEKAKPTYLEVAFSNTCNLQCLYCDPRSSSRWYIDYLHRGGYTLPSQQHDFNPLPWIRSIGSEPRLQRGNPLVEKFSKWIPDVIDNLHTLRLTGGEPTLSKKAMLLLTKTASQVKQGLLPKLRVLAINTNLMGSEPVMDVLVDISNMLHGTEVQFQVFASVDAWGADAESVRPGLNFKLFWNNFQRLSSEMSSESILNCMISVNYFSMFSLHVLLDSIMNERTAKGNAGFSLSRIDYPEFLSLRSVSTHGKLDLAKRLAIFMKSHKKSLLPDEVAQLDTLIEELGVPSAPADVNKHFKDRNSFIAQFHVRNADLTT